MKKRRAAFTVFFVFVAMVAAFLLASRDIPPPDTSDLVVVRPDLPPEENAYTFFTQATNVFYWPKKSDLSRDYLDGKEVDQTALVELVETNGEMVELIKRGIACPRCITPEVKDFSTLQPYISSWLSMGKWLAIKTRHDRLEGRYGQAVESCILLLQFSNRIQADAGSIVDYLVGIATLDLGLIQAEDIIRDAGTPPDELKRLAAALDGLGPFSPGLIQAFKGEYCTGANSLDLVLWGDLIFSELFDSPDGMFYRFLKRVRVPDYSLQPNRIRREMAALYREMITNVPCCYAGMTWSDVEGSLNMKSSLDRFKPNGVGRYLCSILVPACRKTIAWKCKAECGVDAARLLAACRMYREQYGVLPDDLQALVPEFLPDVPSDPYDGKPFRYSPSSGVVYSVGPDLMDSGGSTRLSSNNKPVSRDDRRWKTEDLVFNIDGYAGSLNL